MTETGFPTTLMREWVQGLFEAMGSTREEATLVADHLVSANLSGHDSHGVSMIPLYVESFMANQLVLNQTLEVVVDTGQMLIIDAGLGLGQSAAHAAMVMAIERAQEHGMAMMGLRNAHHIGRIGHWAEMATDASLVSVHFTNAMSQNPVVAPHGGREARYVTNPFTVGIPRKDKSPVLLDFATSAIAHGKARVAMNAGLPVPEGTIIDASGRPTTDPRAVFDEPAGALKTFAAHKGHALAMVCELLGAAMLGGVTGRKEHLLKYPGVMNNMLAIVFDPDRLGTRDSFEHEASAFIDWVRSSALDDVGDALGGILVPGEPEVRARKAREQHLPLDAGTLAALADAAMKVCSHVSDDAAVRDPRDLVA